MKNRYLLGLLLCCGIWTMSAQEGAPSEKEQVNTAQHQEGVQFWMTAEEKDIQQKKNKIRKSMCEIDDAYRAGKISKEEHAARKQKLAATIKGAK